MKIANKPLNWQAIAIEEAETQIRKLVKDEYFKQTPVKTVNGKVARIIAECLNKIRIPGLKVATRQSLSNFYQRQWREISRSLNGYKLQVVRSAIKLTDPSNELVKNVPVRKAQEIYDTANLYGVPMKKFSEDYFKQNVKPVFDRLTKQYPFDPASIPKGADAFWEQNKHINSLRNRAELEVRYNGHLENIENLRQQGNKLVIASSHADCSDRCREWQGRVFSLDGTSGTTPDGRKYVPLEKATDVYYTTKAGKVWKNGLLGFNCRHYLVAYKDGYRFPKPSAEEERKQYAITEKQRQYERNVRYWKTKAIYEKDVDKDAYKKAREKAITWNKKYIEFSHSNNRAYYPSRTKIL